MNTANQQVIAFHVGRRSEANAKALFNKVPAVFREHATFFTVFWQSYNFLEPEKHIAAGKEKGYTNHIERFNWAALAI
jgi:IS1 family transposase